MNEQHNLRHDDGHERVPEPRFLVLGKSDGEFEQPKPPSSVQEGITLIRDGNIFALMEMIAAGEVPDELLEAQTNMTLRDLAMLMHKPFRELKVLADTDAMTGLLNKRVLLESIDARIKSLHGTRRASDGQPFAVVMTDIDHFKSFNDTHGHDVGDEVLKLVASKLESALRTGPNGSDLAARYGGEEFGFIIDGVATDQQMQAVLDTLHALKFPNDWRDITLSIGGVVCTPDTVASTASAMDLLKQADIHLYHTKEGGRNGYSFTSTLDHSKRVARHDGGETAAFDVPTSEG